MIRHRTLGELRLARKFAIAFLFRCGKVCIETDALGNLDAFGLGAETAVPLQGWFHAPTNPDQCVTKLERLAEKTLQEPSIS